jgi:PAS domain S-box-containing protein
MPERSSEAEERKTALKGLIKRLHRGEPPDRLRREFARLIAGLSPEELARAEEELIREGLPREEVQRLCDLHLAVFKERLEGPKPPLPPGHPLQILVEEHELLRGFAADLKGLAQEMKEKGANSEGQGKLRELIHHLLEAESHYKREENVLFPYLERHGITEPPAIMWQEHDKLRGMKKELARLVEAGAASEGFAAHLAEKAAALEEMLSSHIYKENNILFPAALTVITEEEWPAIREEFDALGYCCFTPEPGEFAEAKTGAGAAKAEAIEPGLIQLETGSFSTKELEALLDALPVDITFVDKDDTVRYFNEPRLEGRIFTRTKAVLGRKVQQCHPQKSLHLVNQILEDFRSGKREVAEFWINLKGRLIYIRYFPVRGKEGEYLGCLEVTQDITGIKKIEGEKRLL